jgi:histidinol-phosphate aminotransferase
MKRDPVKLGPGALVREEILSLQAYHVAPAAGMIKLDAMENPYRLPEPLRSEIGQLVATLQLNRYPDPAAPQLTARLRTTFGIGNEHGLMIGNGSDEIIQIVAHALARPEAALVAPEPSFAMYRMNAMFARMRYVGVPLNADFTLDLGRFLAAIEAHRPAVIFLAYPNNPTGNLFPQPAVEAILAAASGLVVLDEAYHVFAGETFMSRLGEYPNLMVMRTVSKLGLAGVRLGYAAARPEWIHELDKVRPPYNVSILAQHVAERMLAHIDVLHGQAERIKVERTAMFDWLAGLKGVTAFPSEANFILARVPDADAMDAALKARKILVRNLHGSHPLLANCLRLTVGTPGENELMLAALAENL